VCEKEYERRREENGGGKKKKDGNINRRKEVDIRKGKVKDRERKRG